MLDIKNIYLDTSFFIRLFKPDDPHHQHAQAYFRRFRNENVRMFLSTLTVAEFGIGSNVDFLPYSFLQLHPFNIDHARLSASMAKAALGTKSGMLKTADRTIIPSDTKIMAQAEVSKVDLFVSRDDNCEKLFSFFQKNGLVSYRFLDLRTPPNEFFNELFDEV